MRHGVLLATLMIVAGPALAQQPPLGRPIGSAWTSSDSGNEMSNFRARVAGGQCIATMTYRMRDGNSGKTQWTFTAEKQPGHIRCTGGRWQDLSGSPRTGPVSDLIQYQGRFYWAQR